MTRLAFWRKWNWPPRDAEVFVSVGYGSKNAGRIHQVSERDAAEAHAEAIEKTTAGKASGGEWSGADLLVHGDVMFRRSAAVCNAPAAALV